MMLILVSICFQMYMHSVVCWLQLEMPSPFEIWLRLLSGTGGQDERPSVQSLFPKHTCCNDTLRVCVCVCVCTWAYMTVCLFDSKSCIINGVVKGQAGWSAPARCPLLPCIVITLVNWLEVVSRFDPLVWWGDENHSMCGTWLLCSLCSFENCVSFFLRWLV